MLKKWICLLMMVLFVGIMATAYADPTETVLFEGEKSGVYNKKAWKDLVVLNFDFLKVDRSIFSRPFEIEVTYESENAPVLFLMSWSGGNSKIQVEADEAEGGVARYTYDNLQQAYGSLFTKLDSITIRPNGADLTVWKVRVITTEDTGEEAPAMTFEGKAGEWLADIRVGWNLGNTLDSIGAWIGNNQAASRYETAWCNPMTTQRMIDMVADAGFGVIRIPVSWGQHLDAANTIDEKWMSRVQTVVDWSLEAGLKVILNMHHDTGTDGWLRADPLQMDTQAPKFVRIWEQIAARFANYDDRLAFEGYNELLDSKNSWGAPSRIALDAANALNQMFVDTVRASGGGNAERILFCNTYAAAHDEGTLNGYVLPNDTAEKCLVAQVHVYSPIDFCFAEADGHTARDWRAIRGQGEVDAIMNRLYTHFVAKGIPVIIGEFSANSKKNETSRADWAAYVTKSARQLGIVCVWWDNGGYVHHGAEGYVEMGLLDRYHYTWLYPQIVKVLTGEDVTDPVRGKTWRDYASLAETAAPHGFKLGACYSYSQLTDKEYMSLMATHFNSITPTNELKAYSLLNASKTRSRSDGMPGLDWTQADRMLTWAQKNGVQVRGHVLVWDAYMTDWFFREGYDAKKPYADQETIRARMAYYIREVMTHCEENFPGVVYCWDVVNEAVGDSAGEYSAADPRHLRTVRSGQPNLFRELAGDDYVEYAFLCARNTVEELGADIALFYNDYNTFNTGKRTAIAALVRSINSYAQGPDGSPRRLIDGVGMQGYIGGYGTQNGCMNSRDVDAIRDTIQLFGGMGLQVQLTEMAIRNYSDAEEENLRHAAFTRELFDMFAHVNDGREQPILTCVALWGIKDCNSLPENNYTWKLNGPYCGLVTEQLGLKRAFDSVYQALAAE